MCGLLIHLTESLFISLVRVFISLCLLECLCVCARVCLFLYERVSLYVSAWLYLDRFLYIFVYNWIKDPVFSFYSAPPPTPYLLSHSSLPFLLLYLSLLTGHGIRQS